MTGDERTPSTGSNSTGITGVSRRRLLKGAGAAVVGTAALGAAVNSGVADTDQIMELDLRDGVPPVTDAPQNEDEVIFNVHGYTGSSASVSEAQTLQDTLRSLGNTETVTAVTWDDSGFPSTAEASARDQGGVFADWMELYLNENPGTTIRILGHSMGGIVTFEFISSANGRFRIANADSIGSYEVSDAPCEGTEFHQAIDNVTKFTGNYFSTNDGIARLGSGPADCSSSALPANYADVDVSSSVSDHTSYKSSTGCVQAIINNYVPGVDRGAGTATPTGTATQTPTETATQTPTETATPTPGGGNAPVIDSFDASEDSAFTDDTTSNWAVSDSDGDLATVESILLTDSGTTLDTASSDVSGSSASGSHSLDPPWYAEPDLCRLVVTDGAGNSVSAQVSV